jgi:hypothetical protein
MGGSVEPVKKKMPWMRKNMTLCDILLEIFVETVEVLKRQNHIKSFVSDSDLYTNLWKMKEAWIMQNIKSPFL